MNVPLLGPILLALLACSVHAEPALETVLKVSADYLNELNETIAIADVTTSTKSSDITVDHNGHHGEYPGPPISCEDYIPFRYDLFEYGLMAIAFGFGAFSFLVGYRLWYLYFMASVAGHVALSIFVVLLRTHDENSHYNSFWYISVGVGGGVGLLSYFVRKTMLHVSSLNFSWLVYGMIMVPAYTSRWGDASTDTSDIAYVILGAVIIVNIFCSLCIPRVMMVTTSSFVGAFLLFTASDVLAETHINIGATCMYVVSKTLHIPCFLGLPAPQYRDFSDSTELIYSIVIWVIGGVCGVLFQLHVTAKGFHHNKPNNNGIEGHYDDITREHSDTSLLGVPASELIAPNSVRSVNSGGDGSSAAFSPNENNDMQEAASWRPAWAAQRPPAYEDE